VNLARLVQVDERLLEVPKSRGECPVNFAEGIHCGLTRFANAANADPAGPLFRDVVNGEESMGFSFSNSSWPAVTVGNCWHTPRLSSRRFRKARLAFCGVRLRTRVWRNSGLDINTLNQLGPVQLPTHDAVQQAYTTGDQQAVTIERLKHLNRSDFERIVEALSPPRWGSP